AMQAPVTDRYATDLLKQVYQHLGDHGVTTSLALARARADLYRQTSNTQDHRRIEYGAATLWLAGTDATLLDATPSPQPLSAPADIPAGGGVRELPIGELIGRRSELRDALRLLRDDPAMTARYGATCGVVLTGIGGIGKTALAGRIMGRLRE